MTATRLLDVPDAVLAACQALSATTLADVLIQDGPPAAAAAGQRRILIIGGEWLPSSQSRPAATASRVAAGNSSFEELITVVCSAVAQSGDQDMAARRAEVKAILGAVEEALAADQTLGGLTYSDTGITSVDPLREIQNERGAACTVAFTIAGTALVWNG